MKFIQKFISLYLLLAIGTFFTFKCLKVELQNVTFDGPAPLVKVGSEATFISGNINPNNQNSKIVNLTITNNELPLGYIDGPIEVGISSSNLSNGVNIGAYLYPNAEDNSMHDCVMYADVETIYANADFSYAFSNWTALKTINFECFDTSNVTDMSNMFSRCSSLVVADLSCFDTTKVKKMINMFAHCTNLASLDLSSFDLSSVTNATNLLNNCSRLREINAPKEMGNISINLPKEFKNYSGLSTLDKNTAGEVINIGSTESRKLANRIANLNTCTDYNQAIDLRAQYETLDDIDKRSIQNGTDDSGVNLYDKLEYMEYLMDLENKNISSDNSESKISNITDNMVALTMLGTIGVSSIVGYYFVCKRRYSL